LLTTSNSKAVFGCSVLAFQVVQVVSQSTVARVFLFETLAEVMLLCMFQIKSASKLLLLIL
jgi:hypothetical protein